MPGRGVADLTPRQAEVLDLVAQGLSNAESRTEAAAFVLRHDG